MTEFNPNNLDCIDGETEAQGHTARKWQSQDSRQFGSRAQITPPGNSHSSQGSPDPVAEEPPMQEMPMGTSRSLPSLLAEGCKATPAWAPRDRCPRSLPWVLPLEWEGRRILNRPMAKGAWALCKLKCLLLGVSSAPPPCPGISQTVCKSLERRLGRL